MADFGHKFDNFVDIVEKLRSENGCPWDREQTPDSLLRYLSEETSEAVDALKSGNQDHIKEELGDILYIIILLAQIHAEQDSFDIGKVIDSISEKMIRRHPHVFGNAKIDSVEELRVKWQEIKKEEKSRKDHDKKN